MAIFLVVCTVFSAFVDMQNWHAPYHKLELQQSKNATFVYLITQEAYLKQLVVSIRLLLRNWLFYYPLPITIFYSGGVSLVDLERAVSDVRKHVRVSLVAFKLSEPSFLSNIPVQHCVCCCNNLTARTPSGVLGAHYNPLYCGMNRFRTLDMYRHKALQRYRYFIQLDTDMYIEKRMPYDPLVNMTEFQAVFGFAEKVVLPNTKRDCNSGLYEAIENYILTRGIEAVFIPPRGTSYAGNFNIGDLDFLRSDDYYKFARWINDDVDGIWTRRWGDQAFLPNVLGMYVDEPKHLHFSDLHDDKIAVHKSESLGKSTYKP